MCIGKIKVLETFNFKSRLMLGSAYREFKRIQILYKNKSGIKADLTVCMHSNLLGLCQSINP